MNTRIASALAFGALLSPFAAAQTLTVGGFDITRGRSLSSVGTLGYDQVRAGLTSGAFTTATGCTAVLAAETGLVDAAYLVDKDVFFVGDGSGTVSAAEGAALAAWHSAGGTLIMVGDSGAQLNMANSVLAALGSTAMLGATGCSNLNTGGVISAASNPITNGPFGNVAGSDYSTTITAGIGLGTAVDLVTCTDGTVNYAAHPPGTLGGVTSGGVYFMGDASWFDLFTLAGGSFFNANNLTIALNTFASACGGGGSPITVVCDPANNHTQGNYTKLDNSTLSAPSGILSGLHLEATDGPAGEFGYFLVSAGASASLAVSNGILCLDGPQGRYAPAAGISALNSIGSFDGAGTYNSSIQAQQGWDVPTGLPTPPGGTINAGSTWYFQMWYRDGQRSNFSNAICVTF